MDHRKNQRYLKEINSFIPLNYQTIADLLSAPDPHSKTRFVQTPDNIEWWGTHNNPNQAESRRSQKTELCVLLFLTANNLTMSSNQWNGPSIRLPDLANYRKPETQQLSRIPPRAVTARDQTLKIFTDGSLSGNPDQTGYFIYCPDLLTAQSWHPSPPPPPPPPQASRKESSW